MIRTDSPPSPRTSRQPGKLHSLALLMAVLPLLSCGSESHLESASTMLAARIESPMQDSAPEESEARKLAHTAQLSLEVESYAEARAAIDAELKRLGGFIQHANVHHNDGRVSSATLTLRLPAASLDSTLSIYSQLGAVLYENRSAEDVTEQHFDLQSRLSNARKLETRLLELLGTEAKDLKDLLELERELARVRESVERLDATLLSLDKRVAFSTLTLDLRTRNVFVAGVPRTLGEEIGDTFAGSLAAMSRVARTLLMLCVGVLPWLVPLLLMSWLALRALRKRRQLARA